MRARQNVGNVDLDARARAKFSAEEIGRFLCVVVVSRVPHLPAFSRAIVVSQRLKYLLNNYGRKKIENKLNGFLLNDKMYIYIYKKKKKTLCVYIFLVQALC